MATPAIALGDNVTLALAAEWTVHDDRSWFV